MCISEIICNLAISKNENFEIIDKLLENYRKMHQILADKWMVSQTNLCTFSQQIVIKKDLVVPSNDVNLSWFNADNLAKN